MIQHSLGILLCVVAVIGSTNGGAAGDQPADTEPSPKLRFRRVFVPASTREDWPLGQEKYLPIDADQFEQLLAASAESPGDDAQPAVSPRLLRAEYAARLDGDRLTGGHGTLSVAHRSDTRSLLRLDPCSLAVRTAVWSNDESRPAAFGLGVDGTLDVVVEQSGILEIDWSLKGHRDAAGILVFPVRLPPSPVSRLLLETRDDVVVTVDHGMVLDAGRGDNGYRRWHIELGNRFEFNVRIAGLDSELGRQGLALVREQTTFDVSPRGIEVTTELNLEVHHEPLGEIVLHLDEPLQLVRASLGEEPVPWTVAPGEDGQVTRVTIRLPLPAQGAGLVLRLSALAPLPTEPTWQLPRIRTENIFWQEGSAALLVRLPLVVERFLVVGGRQTGTEVLPAPRQGESFQLQFFHSDATVELDVAEHRDQVEAVSGTSVRWGEEEVRARVRADFRLRAGTQYRLTATLGPRWMIDTVESAPADAIDDWSVEPDDQGRRQFVVRLARPLAPGRPIRLSVEARRLGLSLGEPFAVDALAPLRFDATESGRSLVGVRTPEVCELEYVSPASARALSHDSLQPGEVELLDIEEGVAVFRLDGAASNPDVRLRLRPRQPRFAAEVDVEACIGEGVLTERYRIECIPEASRLDRLIVWFGQRRETPLNWSVAGKSDVRVSARPWTSDERLGAGLSVDGEVWEVHLSPPVSKPFSIVAHREATFADRTAPSLASVPDARVQSGLLTIRTDSGAVVDIENRRLPQLSPKLVPEDRYTTERAVYRYDPWREVGRIGEEAVVVRRATQQTPLAFVWELILSSRFAADGMGSHLAVFHVENMGQNSMRFRIPADICTAGPVEVWVDGQMRETAPFQDGTHLHDRQPEAAPIVRAPCNELEVSLPPKQRFSTVTLNFASRQPSLQETGVLRAPWPEPDVVVLDRSWTVWLPPAYSTYGGEDAVAPLSAPSPSWSERLLGPLGRPANQPPMDPLVAEHWLDIVGGSSRRHEALLQVRHWLHAAWGGEAQGEVIRLSDLLTHASVRGLKRRLLVDRNALARQDVSPADPLITVAPAATAASSQHALTRSGLALLICRDALLLTTQTNAARLRPHLDTTPLAQVWWVSSRPLTQRLAYAARAADDEVFLPVVEWVAQPRPVPWPWELGSLSSNQAGDQSGWRAYSPQIGAGEVRVRYYHGHSSQLAGAVGFLLVVAFGWWVARNRPRMLLATACLAGVAALWVPEPLIPVASGVVLGVLFCLAFRLVHGRLTPLQRTSGSETSSVPHTVSAAVPWGLAILVSTLAAGACPSVADANQDMESNSGMYRVFIPVDDEKSPVGGKYFLPEPLFAELHRVAAARRDLPQGWLLGEASYRGELVREAVGEQFLVNHIRAQFDLHVFSPAARVSIPLERSGANLLPDGVRLDGRVVQVEWSTDNRALLLEVTEPGQYQIELRMRPRMLGEPPYGFDLSIPPLPMAQLELALPSAAPAIEVSSALGASRREDEPARMIADLGPADTLAVRWPSGTGGAGAGPAVDIEQLLWMQVQPGSVLVEAQWKLAIVEGQVRELRLAVDPRMRMLPLEGDRSPTVRTLPSDSELLHLVLEWEEPLEGDTVVSARFLMTGTSGIGNLRLPQLDVLDARLTRRWMAVSVAEALQFERHGTERLSPITPPEFVSAWGTGDGTPSFAYRLPAGTPDWTLATRPREPKTSAEHDLTLRCDANGIDVALKAKLQTTSGYGFHYRIAAPRELEVTRIALMLDEVDRAVRWSRDAEGAIHLFLASPVSGEQQLLLQGRLPGNLGTRVPVPCFVIDDTELTGTSLHVMRSATVLVELRNDGGPLLDNAATPDFPMDDDWIPVGTYHIAPQANQPTMISVTANEPKLAGIELLRLTAVDGGWHARWECRLDIRDGLVGELPVEGPVNWGNQFRVSDGVSLKVGEVRGTRQELLLRPMRPVQGHWWLWVSGRLKLGPGEAVSVPDIRLRGIDTVSRFVILPRHINGLVMNWRIQGLEPVPLEKAAPELAPEQGVLAAFRVVGKSFAAELPDLPASWEEGRVHLAEYAFRWQEGIAASGSARFDIETGADPTCALYFPEGSQPVLIKVDGVPAPFDAPSDSRVIEVPLGLPGIPQRVEVVFEVTPSWSADGKLTLAAPRVLALPIEQTLCTLFSPLHHSGRVLEALSDATPLQVALARLERLSAVIERYATAAGDASPDVVRWYRRWLAHWMAARRMAQMEIGRLPEEVDRRQSEDRIAVLTKQQRETAARLEAIDAFGKSLEAAGSLDAVSDAWHAAHFRGRPLIHHVTDGSFSKIEIETISAPSRPLRDRVLATAAWIGLVSLLIMGLRRGLVPELFRRWPQASGVIVGLGWWLWLSPSLLGIVVVLACVATSLRAGWRSMSRPVADGGVASARSLRVRSSQWTTGSGQ